MALSILEALPPDSRAVPPANRPGPQARTDFSRVFDAARAGAAESADNSTPPAIAAGEAGAGPAAAPGYATAPAGEQPAPQQPEPAAADRQAAGARPDDRTPQQAAARGESKEPASEARGESKGEPKGQATGARAADAEARPAASKPADGRTGSPQAPDRRAAAQRARPEATAGGGRPESRLAAAAQAPGPAQGDAAARKAARPRDAREADKAAAEATPEDARKGRAALDTRARRPGERVLTAAEQLVATVAARHQPVPAPAAQRSAGEPEKKAGETPRRDGQADPRVVVIDLRKAPPQPAKEKAPEPVEPASKAGRDGDREGRGLAVTLFKADRNGDAPAAAPATQAAGRFREAVQAELVRHSTMVLRDDGATSEMRLVLKPESLGAVRIHLRMADNRIEGQIVVDNKNVRQLFESVLPSLEDGLRQQGFGSASLEVSVGHRDATPQREPSPDPGRAEAVGSLAGHVKPADRWAVLRLGDGLVNLIV